MMYAYSQHILISLAITQYNYYDLSLGMDTKYLIIKLFFFSATWSTTHH